MSYYNHILKCIDIDSKDIEKYNDEYQDDYSIFFEGCKDFDKLKNAVGISCFNSSGEVIVLKSIREGSVMIRPRDLIFPVDTFYGEAGCFIVLDELKENINPEISQEQHIKDGIKEYIKYISPKKTFIVMAY